MKRLHFEQLQFSLSGGAIVAHFMRYYTFSLPLMGHVMHGDLLIDEKDEKKVMLAIQGGLSKMIFSLDKKSVTYLHEDMPLVGANFIGIVDRDTNILEVKPLTGCNINCTFCSVDEGTHSKKTHHYLAEADLLAEKTLAIASQKKHDVMIYINPHGDPLLYGDLARLIHGLQHEHVKIITLITNGVLLSEALVDTLVAAGLSQINISLNAWSAQMAQRLASQPYPVEKVRRVAAYASSKIPVVISPVLVPGHNEEEIEHIVQWVSLHKNMTAGVQNFLPYKRGRNPAKPMAFDSFSQLLKTWEERYHVSLLNPSIAIPVHEDAVLERPHGVGQHIDVTIIGPGRFANEAVGVCQDRLVTVRRAGLSAGKRVSAKVIKNKHNIYYAV